MFRLVAIEVVLFLLPFALWLAMAALRRRGEEVLPHAPAPVMKLATVGLALVCLSLIALAVFSNGTAGGEYVPDRFENGRVVPGHFK
jgi:hypothetical protein